MDNGIKAQLLFIGMKESEIDTHASDLYVLKNDISQQWVNEYQFKGNVTVFRSEVDNALWYDIPFGYMNEHYNERYDI